MHIDLMTKVTVLVTGGAGFIGSHIADRLVSEGYRVVIVDDLSSGTLKNVNPRALFYQVDLRDYKAIEEVFDKEKPTIVNHHAAQVDVTKSVSDPATDAHINIIGGINLLKSACKHGVQRFIYASTAAVYGDPEYVPIDEDHPIKPLSAYGISKSTFEKYLELEASRVGMHYVILRYANVFGPRQVPHGEGGVVAVFANRMLAGEQCRIFGNGSKTRDYVYVQDVVEANILAMQSAACGVFNIGTAKETTDQEVFDTVRAAVGSSQEPIYADERPGEIRRSCFDASKAKTQLGWKAKVSFAEGVASAVEFYRRNKQ